MYARTTLFEVDLLRTTLPEAERLFVDQALPAIQERPGYEGAYLMLTREGKGMVLTLWDTADSEQSGVDSGYYEELVSRFVTFMRQPPGREEYEVVYAEGRALSRT
jgi:heme-degrading monooxygenase HmoA